MNDLWKYDPSTAKWTGVSGSNAVNGLPVYGQQGVAASGNVPGALQGAVGWVGPNGNFWLFGGENGSNYYNTLWKYHPTTNEWTWVSGSKTRNASGNYGTRGTASAGNTPGGRDAAAAWLDPDGTTLWLFGGEDYSLNNYNDLWKYQQ